jgi:hypothetical protein
MRNPSRVRLAGPGPGTSPWSSPTRMVRLPDPLSGGLADLLAATRRPGQPHDLRDEPAARASFIFVARTWSSARRRRGRVPAAVGLASVESLLLATTDLAATGSSCPPAVVGMTPPTVAATRAGCAPTAWRAEGRLSGNSLAPTAIPISDGADGGIHRVPWATHATHATRATRATHSIRAIRAGGRPGTGSVVGTLSGSGTTRGGNIDGRGASTCTGGSTVNGPPTGEAPTIPGGSAGTAGTATTTTTTSPPSECGRRGGHHRQSVPGCGSGSGDPTGTATSTGAVTTGATT